MRRLLKTAMRIKGGHLESACDRATRDPRAAQTALLLDLLRRNQDTQYGREHGFSRIATADTFARAVSVNTFSDLSPYVQKMKRGERNILTSEQPVWFSLTSGTTGRPKYVPITKEGMTLCANASHQWLQRALRDHPAFLDDSIVCLSGAAIEGKTESGIPYGCASGMMYKALPRVLHRSFALPFLLSEIEDYDLRYYVMARIALEHKASFIVTPNPTTLLKLAETGIQNQEQIVRSIHDGVLFCAWPFEMSAADSRILGALGARLRPNRRRARFLARVMRQHGRLLPSACWEELKLMGCWLGGSIGFQAAKLAAYFGEALPRRDIGYLASEGTITIPYEDNTPGGILALSNHYYEFIPADESSATGTCPLQCHELEDGKQYKIILTNRNGLYRYDIHDIIEVCGFYNRTPVVAFARKGDDILNITGEKLHVNHFIEAFRQVRVAHALSVLRFRVVPNYRDVREEILMDIGEDVSPVFLRDTVLPLLDKSLAAVNIEYDAKRKSGRLAPPCIHVMDGSWQEDARRGFTDSGHRDVQYKWRAVGAEVSDVDKRHILRTITM